MIQLVDLLENVVSDLQLNVKVKSITANANGTFTLSVDNTWYLHSGKYFKLGTDFYKVVDFTLNTSLTIKPFEHENTPTTGTYTLENPIYHHGKVKPTLQYVGGIKNWYKKPPLVWVYEIFSRNRPSEPDTAIDSQGQVRILFLMTNKWNDWTTDDHYTQVINPLNQVVDEFESKLRDYRGVGLLGSQDRVNHANFGSYSIESPTATEQNLLNLHLSGIEYAPDIPLTKSCN